MDAAAHKNISLVRHALESLEGGDLDACVELLAADFTAHLPGLPEPLRGREVWRMGARAMLDGFPDLRIHIEDIFGMGERVAVNLRLRGTHRGTFEGVPATGRPVDFRSIELYRVAGDRIAEEWVAPDTMGLMRQISGPAGF